MKDMANGNFNAKQVNIAENNSEIGANVINGGIDNRKQTIINKPPVSQIKYKEPETYRPSLKDREDNVVTGVGYISKKYDDKKYTIINLVDDKGYYMADHTQLDMKEYEYNYNINLDETRFVEFTGKVKEYIRSNGTKDYEIILQHKPKLFDGKWVSNPDLSIIAKEPDIDKIINFISCRACTRDIQDLIIKISKELNILTKFEYENNFIFDYIVNTFFLNRATYDLYEGNIRSISCSNDALMDLLYIISAVYFDFKTSNIIKLDCILSKITYWCNVIQNVVDYFADTKSPNCKRFKKYCKQHLNIETSEELSKAWDVMKNRKRNFGKYPNPDNYKLSDILEMSYYVLNQYIN
jgi:hypothetical protein